jgi:hypothetical protein
LYYIPVIHSGATFRYQRLFYFESLPRQNLSGVRVCHVDTCTQQQQLQLQQHHVYQFMHAGSSSMHAAAAAAACMHAGSYIPAHAACISMQQLHEAAA